MFYEKVSLLCKKNGTNITALCKELKISTSRGTNWKQGMNPSAAIVKRIAEHFGVSVDYLLSDTEDIHNRPLTDNEIAMLELFEKLGERDQIRFIGRLEEFVTVCNDKTGEYK